MKETKEASLRQGVGAVQAVLRALAAGASVDEALELVVERVCALLPATEVMILLLQGEHLLLRAGRGIEGAHLPRLAFADGTPIESWVATHDTALFVPDVSCDPRFRAIEQGRNRITALAAAPIRIENEVVGVLEIGEEYKADFRENGALLSLMADVAGIVIEHARAAQRACDRASNELLRTMRHDFRSPLTAINGYAQLLQRRAIRDGRPRDVQTAGIIVQQVQRMTAMLDVLRDSMPADDNPDEPCDASGPNRSGALGV
jgi:GAF domain-containing protein